MTRRISSACLKLVQDAEGLYLKAYLCPAGVPTIGYGHTKGVTHADVETGRTINRQQATDYLAEDMAGAAASVERLVKVPLSQEQFDALASFEFNTGGLSGSTLLKKLNSGGYAGAAAQFGAWNKATVKGKKEVLPGLVKRRAAEAALFLSGEDVERMAQKVDVPAAKRLSESRTAKAAASATGLAAGLTVLQQVKDGADQAGAMVTSLQALPASPLALAALVLAAALGYAVWRAYQRSQEVS